MASRRFRIASAAMLVLGMLAIEHASEAAFPGAVGKIVFVRQAEAGNYELFTMNPDGSAVTRLTYSAAQECCPDWSPDGTKIAVAPGEIRILRSDGTVEGRLRGPGGSRDPAWSPDGDRIAFASYIDNDEEIFVINIDGSSLTRLTSSARVDRDPAWSPDGTKIAFSSERDGQATTYVMNADGSNQSALASPSCSGYSEGYTTAPSWSPNGVTVAFSDLCSRGIRAVDADGSNLRQLTTFASDSNPDWSPDGSKIVFSGAREGDLDLYVMNADGSNVTLLTRTTDSEMEPDWQSLLVASPTPTATASPQPTSSPSPTPTPSPTVSPLPGPIQDACDILRSLGVVVPPCRV